MSDAIARGMQAQIELRETGAAFEYVRRAILDELAATEPQETATREQLFLEARCIEKVRARLAALMADGAYEQHVAELKSQGF